MRRLRLRRRDRAAVLAVAELVTVLTALADAATHCRSRIMPWCVDCEMAPLGACPRHIADLETADAYDDLAAALKRRTR